LRISVAWYLMLVLLATTIACALGAGAAAAEEGLARTLIPSETTATSNTYRLPSGALQTEVYGLDHPEFHGDWFMWLRSTAS
jgi:hypothetical protein